MVADVMVGDVMVADDVGAERFAGRRVINTISMYNDETNIVTIGNSYFW